LLLMVAGAFALAYLFWDQAVDAVLQALQSWALFEWVTAWLASVGLGQLKAVVAPLLVILLATPLIVLAALLLVAWMMTPAIVELVALRRFPDLRRERGGGWFKGLLWSLWSTLLALLLLLLSLPLWLVPPLLLVLPALIWGWLTYRVLSYDTLAEHASAAERRALMQQHRWPLLAIGVFTGLLGAAPSLLWASGAMVIALAPLLVPLAIWIYALVFAFSSLWYAHYLLQALAELRRQHEAPPQQPSVPPTAAVIDVQARELPPAPSADTPLSPPKPTP
jgi:hypothetical protein